MEKCKKLFIPLDPEEKPRIIIDRKVFDNLEDQCEWYCISSELSMFTKGLSVNPHIYEKYKIEVYGACLIVREIDEDDKDVDDNLFDQLGDIMKKDERKRKEYFKNLIDSGYNVINISN